MKAEDLCVGLCTVPDYDQAKVIARTLVEERLAACVNLVPRVTSVYRWHGKVEENDEVLLVIKTAVQADLEKMKDRLLTLHPYDVPELLLLPVTYGLDKYLDWIGRSIEPAEAASE
jgi:periplasmic divalent cation tolerance protein